MLYDELELMRLMKKGYKNMSIEEEIKINILNFISCIHSNNQDFYRASFNSQYFGDLEMEFIKKPGSLIGYVSVRVKKENREMKYLFTEKGYEILSDVIRD